jgi:hypothetical protein
MVTRCDRAGDFSYRLNVQLSSVTDRIAAVLSVAARTRYSRTAHDCSNCLLAGGIRAIVSRACTSDLQDPIPLYPCSLVAATIITCDCSVYPSCENKGPSFEALASP